MNQPQTQSMPQLTCNIHNQPACAIKCTDLETCSAIKCILCIMKENLQAKDLITLLEIFNPEVEQASSALFQLTEDQMTKLMKIQRDNPERQLATIQGFFSSLKEEIILKINEQEKIAIDQAHNLIGSQKKLNMKFQEFRKDLKALISTNQNNQEQLNQQLKKYFKEINQSKQKGMQQIQDLIANYENLSFNADSPNISKQQILNNISEMGFFKVSSEKKTQKMDEIFEINSKQQTNLQKLINSTEILSQMLSTTASLFSSNEPLDFSFVQTIVNENQSKDTNVNLKEVLCQNQQKLIAILFNSDQSVKQILKILKPLSISQRLNALSVLVQNLPTQEILSKILFKVEDTQCQFVNSKYPNSKPIQGQYDFPCEANMPIIKLFNQGLSSLYSDCVLDPKLKYQFEIVFDNDINSHELCYFGLLPDSEKDSKLMNDLNLAFSNGINTFSQRFQKQQQESNQIKQTSFSNTVFICIQERIFIVCDQKGDVILTIPENNIQSTTQYRIGIQFQSPELKYSGMPSSDFFNAQKPYRFYQQYYLNLTLQSFKILSVFPLFCI